MIGATLRCTWEKIVADNVTHLVQKGNPNGNLKQSFILVTLDSMQKFHEDSMHRGKVEFPHMVGGQLHPLWLAAICFGSQLISGIP